MDKVSWAAKSLVWKGFLGRQISGWERFPGQRNLFLGKVAGKNSLPGKSSLDREISARKDFWKKFPSCERFYGQRNFCLVKVFGKSFQDCKGCSNWIRTSQLQNMQSAKLGNFSQNQHNWETFPEWNTPKFWKIFTPVDNSMQISAKQWQNKLEWRLNHYFTSRVDIWP